MLRNTIWLTTGHRPPFYGYGNTQEQPQRHWWTPNWWRKVNFKRIIILAFLRQIQILGYLLLSWRGDTSITNDNEEIDYLISDFIFQQTERKSRPYHATNHGHRWEISPLRCRRHLMVCPTSFSRWTFSLLCVLWAGAHIFQARDIHAKAITHEEMAKLRSSINNQETINHCTRTRITVLMDRNAATFIHSALCRWFREMVNRLYVSWGPSIDNGISSLTLHCPTTFPAIKYGLKYCIHHYSEDRNNLALLLNDHCPAMGCAL